MQQVKKSRSTLDFYFSMVSYIKDNSKLPSNAGTNQKINYYLKPLKIDGVVHKSGYGVWCVDWDKWEAFKTKLELKKRRYVTSKNIRGHSFVFKLRLPTIPNWHNRHNYLINKEIPYESIKQGQSVTLWNNRVWLCKNSIVVYFHKDKSIYSDNVQDILNEAVYEFKSMISNLENMLHSNFRISKFYRFTIVRRHFGKINDSMAKEIQDKDRRIRCFYEGKEWLLTDKSLNENEIETTDSKKADVHMDKIVIPFMNDLRKRFELDGRSPTFTTLLDLIEKVTLNQVAFDSNIQKHMEVLQNINLAVLELKDEMRHKRLQE